MPPPHAPPETLEYSAIADGITIGTNQCCQAYFDERLRQIGITADISLEENRVDQPFGVEFYVWLPVKDETAPTLDQLRFGVSVLTTLVQMGRKVYVHCRQGHGRAPTLVAAYFIRKGSSVEEAVALVQRKRPGIHLEETQLAGLRAYAESLRPSSSCCA